MDIISIGLEWLILGVFTICFVAILLFSGNDRFWLPCILMWLFLFFAFIIGNTLNSNEVAYQETVLNRETETTNDNKESQPYQLQEAKRTKQAYNIKLLHLLGFHSFISVFWLLIGYRKTSLNYYKTGAITFAFFTIIYALIVLLT